MRTTFTTALFLALTTSVSLAQTAPATTSSTVVAPGQSTGIDPLSNRPGRNAAQEALVECMRLWEPATHMTKQEWSRTCARVQTRLDQVTKLVAEAEARQKGEARKQR